MVMEVLMSKVRSPNYPNISLGPALEAMRPAFQKENRNKMSRSVLAKHLGYSSLNGRALGKIGAVRAYGLIEGSGDELRITDDAVAALNAPHLSHERLEALSRLAHRPALFQDLAKEFPDTAPSLDNLIFSLVKKQFTPDAAEKAAKSYLATMMLAGGGNQSYNPPDEELDQVEEVDKEPNGWTSKPPTSWSKPPETAPPPLSASSGKVAIMAGERELTTGLLAKGASFRLIVSGAIGVKEIDRLIQKLQIDKEILADQDEGLEGDDPSAWQSKEQPARMPFMVTQAQKQQLRDLGYSAEAISNMTPQRSLDLLASGIKAPPY
jgi:hypothetical protein